MRYLLQRRKTRYTTRMKTRKYDMSFPVYVAPRVLVLVSFCILILGTQTNAKAALTHDFSRGELNLLPSEVAPVGLRLFIATGMVMSSAGLTDSEFELPSRIGWQVGPTLDIGESDWGFRLRLLFSMQNADRFDWMFGPEFAAGFRRHWRMGWVLVSTGLDAGTTLLLGEKVNWGFESFAKWPINVAYFAEGPFAFFMEWAVRAGYARIESDKPGVVTTDLVADGAVIGGEMMVGFAFP